ncbi:hypothetical protein NC651_020597 [Populus alba x Populus x berolinensis]|nr:hypothetical protein NC651_020597 [Populus alba x Populus x berolinensis]
MDLNLQPKRPRCRWDQYYFMVPYIPCSSPRRRMVRWVLYFCCQPGEWVPCYACEVISLLQISLCFVVCSTLNMRVWDYILKP